MRVKNVLVATDFGEASAAALTYGRYLARTFGGTLHVLHVVDDAATKLPSGVEGYMPDIAGLQQSLEAFARKELEAIVTDDDRRDLDAKIILRTSITPAETIVSYAKEAEIDLITMGTHGRGAIAPLFMGSVADRVIRLATCPVLTVKHLAGHRA